MWLAFKALTLKAKLGLLGIILAALAVVMGSTAYVSYQKGVNVSRVEIQRYQTNLAELRAKQAQTQAKVDVKIVTEYKDRVAYIDRVVYKTRTVIEQSVPEQFHLSRGWIYAYNQSVLGLELDSAKAADATPSTVSEMRALSNTIAPNNGICIANKTQLEALQNWIRSTENAQNLK